MDVSIPLWRRIITSRATDAPVERFGNVGVVIGLLRKPPPRHPRESRMLSISVCLDALKIRFRLPPFRSLRVKARACLETYAADRQLNNWQASYKPIRVSKKERVLRSFAVERIQRSPRHCLSKIYTALRQLRGGWSLLFLLMNGARRDPDSKPKIAYTYLL
jgi:hypothetical protein